MGSEQFNKFFDENNNNSKIAKGQFSDLSAIKYTTMAESTAPTCCSRLQNFVGILLYIIGVGLSSYAYYVEYQLENQPGNLSRKNIKHIVTLYTASRNIQYWFLICLNCLSQQVTKRFVTLMKIILAAMCSIQHMVVDLAS